MADLNALVSLIIACSQAAPAVPLAEAIKVSIEPDTLASTRLEGCARLEGSASRSDEAVKTVIPEWLAGKWKSCKETSLFVYDYAMGGLSKEKPHSYTINDTYYRGGEKDENGKFWQYFSTPEEEKPRIDHNLVIEHNFDQFVVKFKGADTFEVVCFTVVTVEYKKSKKLYNAYLEETDITYERIASNLLGATVKVSDWDVLGRPLRVSKIYRLEKRLQAPVDHDPATRDNVADLHVD